MNQQLLPLKAVQTRIPYSKVHIYRLMRDGKFPKSIKIGEKRVAWLAEEIDQWISMIAAAKKWIEFTPKKAMLVISRDGFILWSSSSETAFKAGIYFKTRGSSPIEIPSASLAAQHIKNEEGQIFQPGVWWPNLAVKETTIFSDKYDLIISLLQFYD